MAESTSSNLPALEKDNPPDEKPQPWYAGRVKTEDTENLLPWHVAAVIQHHLFNRSQREVGRMFKKSSGTISEIYRSPGGRRLRARLDELIEDPLEFAKEIAKANALGVLLDRYLALEWAKQEGDASLVDRIAKDLSEIGGLHSEKKKEKHADASTVMHFHFEKGTDIRDVLNAPTIKAEYEVIEDEDDE